MPQVDRMKTAERQTRSYLMKLFSQQGFHPRTDLGQNFLIDLNIVEYIIDQAKIEADDVILEVGTGTGGMTPFLALPAAAVVSVELDKNMYRLAQHAVQGFSNVTLLQCDALKNKNLLSPDVLNVVEQKLNENPARRLKLVSNLPYKIATPVISNLVKTELPWTRMVVTIQLELGRRMTAKPGTSDYGALSVWLQSQCWVKILKTLGPTLFWPRPKVHSAIVRLLPDERGKARIHDRSFFHLFIRRLFHQRRKLVRSVLVGMYRKQLKKPEVDVILKSMSLQENVRAEELDPSTLVALSNCFQAAVKVGESVVESQ